ncbi:BglG family transcription antiterminator [Bacillus sp. 1NLA3E]|uniref:BglG family transcription antiterminator n=1 Tax=Bacillus sp. 1NLA3E TaxID=666686 RepID=UPI000247E2CF|nr:BglG family transcription antiterminator [Bacillus sp. 1NLA3E]AGK55438.1 phosphoenolpyruvate-dependent sugar phosphotransferase system, EIIA 2 [Bacillus sp. 1NLA3E]
MYLDERSNLLLNEVLSNPEISNTILEEKHQLSRRQVSYSFKKINDWLDGKNYPTIKRTNSGKFIVNPKLLDLLAKKTERTNSKYIPSEKERAQLILLMILSSDEELSLIHFTTAMEVSKNTVLRDLKYAQNIINPYQLEIDYSRIHGYDLAGSEWDKRKLLIDILQSIFGIYNGEGYIEQLIRISKTEIDELRSQMEDVETKLHLKFIDEKIKILPYVIAILLKRIKRDKLITDSYHIDYKELSDTKEYEAAELLIQDVNKIPEAERLFLTLQLLTSNVLSSQFLTDTEIPQLRKALEESLNLFEKKACVTLKDKDILLQRLIQHMKPAYYRIKYHLTTNYSVLEKVSDQFEAVHYIVKDSIKPFEDYIGSEIPESEIMFITIYIGGHLINIGETIHIKKKAVVVCPNGVSISKLMENTLRGLFPEFYFYDALSVREFELLKMETDIVFSPVPLQTDKQLFIVDRFITEYEKVQLRQRVMKEIFGLNSSVINVDQIMNIIEKYVKIEGKQSLMNALQDYFSTQETSEKQQKHGFTLSDLITPERIILRDNVENWQEAISIASEPLLSKGIITETYVEAMQSQYPTMSPFIVLRTNIAIPHASPDEGVNSIGMSLLKIKNGLEFEENHKVHLVVVIAAVDKNQHFSALLQLMKLSGETNDVNKIIQMKNENDIHQMIKSYSI